MGWLIWVFFLLVALQPVVSRKLLEASRQKMIEKLEGERHTRMILIVHRQERMSLLGFPLVRYIDVEDSEEVLRAVRLTDSEIPIDLVLHTPGGLVLASLQIARAIQRHVGKVTVFVPHYAMSGGTLIALAADEIVMSEDAVLGPVDPQLGRFPAASVVKVIEQKPIEKVEDETLVLADQSKKALQQVREAVEDLLDDRMPPEKAKELAALLAEGTWTHDFPITYERAKDLGLPVTDAMPKEIYQLMRLYRQPVRTTPTVTYLPGRKGPPPEPPA